ncbi:MAG: dicarboxylate/amino acid:cation symporter [Phocaeicola sp.]
MKLLKKLKVGLLTKIVIAILLGVFLGNLLPERIVRIFITFNDLFSEFLSFIIPLIILGLVAPAIADVGKKAGKILLVTVLISYLATLFSGFLSFFVGDAVFPSLISSTHSLTDISKAYTVLPFFSIAIPPPLNVVTALVLAFALGLGIAHQHNSTLKKVSEDFKEIITRTIQVAILPLLPLYIFGIFASMAYSGQVFSVLSVFIKIIGVIFVLHVLLLIFQFTVAGVIVKKNPFKLLKEMLPAYFTALGTQSSAATIPITLRQSISNGVSKDIAGFVVPLCATIHMSGSALKIVACALALFLMQGMEYDLWMFTGFIFMLGITIVAAPGVPGGVIMASLGILSSILGFGESEQALMIALYIAMDSFGTACNVTGDGAIALIVEHLFGKKQPIIS